MYNRYMPQEPFQPVGPEGNSAPQGGLKGLLGGLLGGRGGGGLPKPDGILKALHLDGLEKGDILLILILVYLYIESDDEDWLIILGLVVLMGL